MTIPADLHVMADDLRLRQVLLNLMSNAIKYSPERTDIDITSDVDEQNITVRIRDRGLGVPPQEQQRLFNRFARLERDMNSPTRGAGLGLHISKQLVEAMGGRIWIESTGIAGEGSTFAFTLKRAMITQQNNPLFLITR
jgi:signal transduction histidine kinase